MNLFKEFGLSPQLSDAVEKLGITDPTEIQAKSIPHIMLGKDLIGESATGSGKTLAFGCGIIDNVEREEGLQALVLTPTRELAEQVKESLRELSDKKPLKIITAYGGVAIGPQINGLRKAEVLVATPGRLLDHINRGTINMSKIKLLVLDEADRMLDMGFVDDVERIIRACPTHRQTLFFSATIPPQIKRLTNKYMLEPITVSAKKHVDASKLKQGYYDIKKNMKLSLLVHLLESENSGLVMVFCNTRRNTDFVVKNLKTNKIDAIAIHGGLSQNKRTKTLSLFNGAKVGVLVCTDVAARGLHIDNVSHIYNYDLPKDAKEYVHRIGRTARAGEEGKVVNLVCDLDYENFSRIIDTHSEFVINKIETPLLKKLAFVKTDENRGRHARRGQSNHRGNNNRNWGSY